MEAERVRHRQRLRRKEAQTLAAQLHEQIGQCPFGDDDPVEWGEYRQWKLLLRGSEGLCVVHEQACFPTVRTLLTQRPPLARQWVEVDQGAVAFITNGADVMAPGVVAADPAILPGQLVYVREEVHKKALLVGVALSAGPAMVAAKEGKAVQTLHHLGDRLWQLFA